MLNLTELRKLSIDRAITGFKTYGNQPITYWTTAIMGEFGELCNMIKKIKRVEAGGTDSGSSYKASDIKKENLEEEIGGMVIYIDLLCSLLGIDLSNAIINTFNNKSEEHNFPQRIHSYDYDDQEKYIKYVSKSIAQNQMPMTYEDWQ